MAKLLVNNYTKRIQEFPVFGSLCELEVSFSVEFEQATPATRDYPGDPGGFEVDLASVRPLEIPTIEGIDYLEAMSLEAQAQLPDKIVLDWIWESAKAAVVMSIQSEPHYLGRAYE